MPFRLGDPKHALRTPIEMTLDGASIAADEGEPIAHALLAAGALSLARSPKFHRPRGPSCLRGACDGCLMRVDGVPNVMTCMLPARAGVAIESQNTLGSRNLDLLRVTDWFFPDGMNHHELFAGVPGVQNVMQAFARRVAGLGRMPDESLPHRPVRPATRRRCDALVIGAGPAGMAAAAALAEQGRTVEIIDDGLRPGGSLLAFASAHARFAAIEASFERACNAGAVTIRSRAVAGAVFADGVLVVGDGVGNLGAKSDTSASEAETAVVEPKILVLATGAHDGVLAFEGNDLPGIFSARAGLRLLASGVAVGKKVAIAVAPGGGPFGALYLEEAERAGAPIEVTLVEGEPLAARGSSMVKEVIFAEKAGGGSSTKTRTIKADALLIDAPRAPSYELPQQAGAELLHVPAGFLVRTDRTRIRPGVYAVGEVVGTALESSSLSEEAQALVAAVGRDAL